MSLPYISVVDHTIMLNFIENVLCYFESCFSRRAAFNWFVTITIGLMLRSDKLGVTSVIHDLALNPGCYDSLLHFFRASSRSLEDIHKRWSSAVRLYAPLYKEGNYHILVGDGVKQSKEGHRMHLPGTEAAGWRILLPLLAKAHAEAELLPEERGSGTLGACGRCKDPKKSTGSSQIMRYPPSLLTQPYYSVT